MAVRGLLTGMVLMLLALSGCGSSPPEAAHPASVPPRGDVKNAFTLNGGRVESGEELMALLDRIPVPEMDFGGARCFLWHPRLKLDEAFLAVVPLPDGGEIAGHLRVEHEDLPTLLAYFIQRGRPVRNEIEGITGWIGVCRSEEPSLRTITI